MPLLNIKLMTNQRFSISSNFSSSAFRSLYFLYSLSMGAMSRAYLMRRLLVASNYLW